MVMFALWPGANANEAFLHSSLQALQNVNVFNDPLGCTYTQPSTSKAVGTQTEDDDDKSSQSHEWKRKCRVISLILYRSVPDYEISLDLRLTRCTHRHSVTGRMIFWFINILNTFWHPIVLSGYSK